MDWITIGVIVLMIVVLSAVQALTHVAPYTKNCMTTRLKQAEGERLIRGKADMEEKQNLEELKDQEQK